jgi:hypothetical protein
MHLVRISFTVLEVIQDIVGFIVLQCEKLMLLNPLLKDVLTLQNAGLTLHAPSSNISSLCIFVQRGHLHVLFSQYRVYIFLTNIYFLFSVIKITGKAMANYP